MPVQDIPDNMVQDVFEMGAEPYLFQDAIVMPKAQYDALTPEQIQAIKQKRYDDWLAIVNPPEEAPQE